MWGIWYNDGEKGLAGTFLNVGIGWRHAHHAFHRVVGVTDDARGEEQPLDVVAAVEFDGQLGEFMLTFLISYSVIKVKIKELGKS